MKYAQSQLKLDTPVWSFSTRQCQKPLVTDCVVNHGHGLTTDGGYTQVSKGGLVL